MIVLEPDDVEHGIVVTGTNAIIVPLRPRMKGEIAECQAPSAHSHWSHCSGLQP